MVHRFHKIKTLRFPLIFTVPLFVLFERMSLFLILSMGMTFALNREWTLKEFKSMDHKRTFKEWTTAFDRNYSSIEEELDRFQIWMDNLHEIASTNSRNLSYKFGLNQFSDMMKDEFQSYLRLSGGVSFESTQNLSEQDMMVGDTLSVQSLPSSLDWYLEMSSANHWEIHVLFLFCDSVILYF